uniref:LAGLIDADG endonuclease n=1 Tax=Sclerotinia borealis TaxID=77105 RepID=A0A088CAV7_9HELO|nr:LAGLIDADG endonuclease [Sclerotinia borealis]AHX83006.1 LAGLIDADG endonuclease [Sclerotinia borealis]
MPQGMVISLVFFLEKLLKVVDMWVIAVLSHSKFKVYKSLKIVSVKEQRVDGSSSSRNLEFVRCTLVAGKPVLGRKFHTHSSKFIAQSNMYKKSIHMINSNLNPWFITGFVDADGCFTLGFLKSDRYKMGYQIQAIFKINLHEKDYNLLSKIQNYFGVGKITKHGNASIQYTVRSLKDLDIIISHFEKYPLLTQKYADYLLFKQGISLLKNKEHLYKEGFIKVLSIKASINLGLSDELELSYPEVKPMKRSLLNNKSIADPNWIAGLASGDGCFFVSIRNSITTKTKKAVVLKFHIVQHSRDTDIMEMLISTIGCGKIELVLKQSAVYFVVVRFKDIFEKIIPLFDNYPIQGIKALDYLEFKKVANLMHNKEHITEQGLSKIQSIKLNMNLSRKL